MDALEVGGLRIAYERAGSGPALVLLHGYVGDGPTTWGPQLDGLSDEFTVVAWDAPGAGGSDDPPEDFGMTDYAAALDGFLRELRLARPSVCGLSFGGALAIAHASQGGVRLSALVLASAYAGWRGSLGPDEAQYRLDQAIRLSALSPDEFLDTLLPTMFSEGTDAGAVSAFGASMRAFHPAGFRAMARASAEDLTQALGVVDVPTLVVHGETDARAPRPVAEHLHASIGDSELLVLPGAGHVCNLEAPDAFDAAVRAFLTRR